MREAFIVARTLPAPLSGTGNEEQETRTGADGASERPPQTSPEAAATAADQTPPALQGSGQAPVSVPVFQGSALGPAPSFVPGIDEDVTPGASSLAAFVWYHQAMQQLLPDLAAVPLTEAERGEAVVLLEELQDLVDTILDQLLQHPYSG